jgi:kinetochore protein Nuf2
VTCGQEALNGEIATISEAITRTRSRIVQSPDRIKRTITTMNDATIEDKKIVTMHEAKARELHVKTNTLLAIEKVCRFK